MKNRSKCIGSVAVFVSCFLVPATTFIGCGSDDDNESDAGAVILRMSADTNPAPLAEGTIISTDFSFSSDDIFDDNQEVALVIFVPSELVFREGTAEIDRPFGDDRSIAPQIFPCANGEFLLFKLDEEDLIDAENPSGDADGRVTLTLDAVARTAGATVQGAARNNSVPFTCEGGVVPDAVVSIVVQ